ncbi:hypothetical protein BS78_09G079500 [Paspalum vaginatum]|nr:hypothetical protein BS78_09G079500 [Paspalum vaginatum]
MDGCSTWMQFQGSGISDGAASGSELQQEQDLLMSSRVKAQLQQIYLLMDMDEEHGHEAPSSLQSSTFSSFSASPDETLSLMPRSSNTITTNSCHHPVDVSSLQPLSPVTYGGHGRAFVPYSRHLSPKKKPKPGSGGQRAIKAAMSAMARMHMARLAQFQCHQMEMAMARRAGTGSSCNQQQHVLSERKRREKLNDSFKALKTVLPRAPKKDKASILIRARDYVNTLRSRVSELEERNRILVEMQHHCTHGADGDNVSSQKIEVDIERAAAEGTSLEFHLKILVGSGCRAMDAVVSILERLKEMGDVRLVAMDTGRKATTLKLHMKSTRCDDIFLKESVIHSVKDVMQSKTEKT